MGNTQNAGSTFVRIHEESRRHTKPHKMISFFVALRGFSTDLTDCGGSIGNNPLLYYLYV
jgi:hypothetical protein